MGGFAKDGAVQEQIEASLEDEVKRARSQLPKGESLLECEECNTAIPEARRKAVPGVHLCVAWRARRPLMKSRQPSPVIIAVAAKIVS